FQVIREWEKTTEMGDRAEIRTLPEESTAWAKIDARAELCAGPKCAQFERCFITLMHQRAAEADIIIVNHHLFFADLAVRRDDMASIDRKSTRLNSSHVKISYAVFCLKKKKNIKITGLTNRVY